MDRSRLASVLGSESMRVGAQIVSVSQRVPPHTHDHVEIAFVIDGDGRHLTRSTIDRAVPGAAFLIRPGTWHAFEAPGDLRVANVYFDERVVFDDLPWLLADPVAFRRVFSAGSSSWAAPPAAFADVVGWTTELEKHRDSPYRVAVGLLTCIIAALIEFGPPLHRERPAPDRGDAVQRVVAAISSDPRAEWTRESMAAAAHLSASHFGRSFLRETGTTPSQFVTQVRLERAAQVLASSDLPIGRVAHLVGIADANYFGRAFRKAYGLSPGAYRGQLRLSS